MDFFQHQETARRRTGLLVFYFAAAVVLIVLLAYVVVDVALVASGPEARAAGGGGLWNPALFGVVTAGTLLLIGGGSLYRIASLSGGGHTVADFLGGRPISPQTTDPDERKVLNVVEEMAIASGTPVPPVYLMDKEDGINAFAAGYSPADAVIGASREGCIRDLNRDELQGVIAHEFSHILNGDMRLNIRLMGVLYGILLISLTGWVIFRSTGDSDRFDRRRDDGDRKGGIPWPLIGLALYVLGYVGVFFGNLIKAAVGSASNASTWPTPRPPSSRGTPRGSPGDPQEDQRPDRRVEDPGPRRPARRSHLFFGDAVPSLFDGLATHPPLVERIFAGSTRRSDGDFSKAVRLPGPARRRPTPRGPGRRSAPQGRPRPGGTSRSTRPRWSRASGPSTPGGSPTPRRCSTRSPGRSSRWPTGAARRPGDRLRPAARRRAGVGPGTIRPVASRPAPTPPCTSCRVERSRPRSPGCPRSRDCPLVSMAVPAILWRSHVATSRFLRSAACVDALDPGRRPG